MASLTLLALSGVDGAGKSTMARELEAAICEAYPEIRLVNAWLRYNPRALLGRKQSADSTMSPAYRPSRAKTVMKLPELRGVWVRVNRRLYQGQLSVQLPALATYDVVIADRFVVDFVADLVRGELLPIAAARELRTHFPPAVDVLVDATDEELTQRLKSGDDLNSVLQHAALYRRLAATLGLPVVGGDGHVGIDDIVNGIGERLG